MNGRIALLIVLAMLLPVGATAQRIDAKNSDSNTSALLALHQQRMDMLEQGLKEIRGFVENSLRELQVKVEQIESKYAEVKTAQSARTGELREEFDKLTDMLATNNRRIERMLEITEETEFRQLRLEKRLQALIALGGENAVAAVVQLDTTAAEAPPNVQMSRETNNGVTEWSIEERVLNRELDALAAKDGAAGAGESGKVEVATSVNQPTASDDETTVDAKPFPGRPALVTPPVPKVLPAVAPEEQYRFALGRAMQNDFEVAERAFAEFRVLNPGHALEVDATYWLGRVQFMRGQYDKAAATFMKFNVDYPGDKRLVDTTLWIAESVSHFAPPDQACVIYADLPKLLDSPPEIFTTKLAELRDAAKCNS